MDKTTVDAVQNTIYTVNQTTKDYEKVNQSVVDFLYTQHKQYISHQEYQAKPLVASGFGTASETTTPFQTSSKLKENGGIVRSFVAITYKFPEPNQYQPLMDKIGRFLLQDNNVKFAFYPDKDFRTNNTFYLVIEVNALLDKKTYKRVINKIIDLIGVQTNEVIKNQNINLPFPSVEYLDDDAYNISVFNVEAPKYPLTEDYFQEEKAPQTQEDFDPVAREFRKEQIEPAIEQFLQSAERGVIATDEDARRDFLESVAEAQLSRLINEIHVQTLLSGIADDDEELKNIQIEYKLVIADLKTTPEMRSDIKSLSTYLPIIAQVQENSPRIKSLSQLLVRLLPNNFKPDTELEPIDVAQIIEQHFEFGLLPEADSDLDNLAVFNPLTGLWTHDEDSLIAMMVQIKPAITPMQIKTVMITWAAKANHKGNYIEPYSGSRYIVFQNGVLDITTMELLPLNSPIVKSQRFTNRHVIKIDYDPNAPLIDFPNDTISGGNWNVEQFIQAYSNNNPDIRRYLLFGLSLGLFAGHNSGVHFNIQGESGSGKSTLATIYRGLYGPQRVAEILFTALNTPFPIDNYAYDCAVIWVKECNTGVPPLDESYGTPIYDALADGQSKIPQKHKKSLIIGNPPQMYIDGTQLIQSTDIETGPARRTLAFKLPSPIEPLRPQFYSNNITQRLSDPRNLKYLVNEMIKSFKELVPQVRWADFKMNLGVKSDVDLLPEEAKKWRQEFVAADANIRIWFDEMIKPSLQLNDIDALVHDEMFHKLYLQWYRRLNPQDLQCKFAKRLSSFVGVLHKIFDEDGLHRIMFKTKDARNRKSISEPEAFGFDWEVYDDSFERPSELRDTGAWPSFFRKKLSGFYSLFNTLPEPPELFEYDGKQQVYLPIEATNTIKTQVEKAMLKKQI